MLQAFFVFLTYFMFSLYIHVHTIPTALDFTFHWQRIDGLSESIKHLQWPTFNTYSGLTGTATPTMYPWITLIPIAIINIFCEPMITLKIFIVGIFLIGLEVSYYATRTLWTHKMESLIFSLTLYASSIASCVVINRFEFSGSINFIIEPLAIIGWIKLMKQSKWKLLAVSMTLMLYTHIMSSVIMVFTLFCLSIITIPYLKKRQIFAGYKAIGTTFLASGIIWLPILILSTKNKIATPGLLANLSEGSFLSLNHTLLVFGFIYCTNIALMLFTLIGLCHFTCLNAYSKRFLLIGIIYISFSIHTRLWDKLDGIRIFQTIQGAWRFDNIGYILIAFATVPLIYKLCKNHVLKQVALIFLILINILIGKEYTYVSYNNIPKTFDSSERNIDIKTNNSLNDYINTYSATNIDYVPRNSRYHMKFAINHYLQTHSHSVTKHQTAQNIMQKTTMYRQLKSGCIINDGIIPNKNTHILPIVTYHAQKYNFYLDGHKFTPKKFEYSEPVIGKLPSGKHRITYQAPLMWYRYVALFMSATGLVALLILDQKKHD